MREVTTPQEIIDIIFQTKVDDKAEGTITPEKIRQIVGKLSISTYEKEDLFYPFEPSTIEKLEETNTVSFGNYEESVSEDEKQELLRTIKRIREIIMEALKRKENDVFMQIPEKSPIENLRSQRWMKIANKPGTIAKLSRTEKLKKSGVITIAESPRIHPEMIAPVIKENGGNRVVSFVKFAKTEEDGQQEDDPAVEGDPPTFNFQDHLNVILGAMEGCKELHDSGYAHNDIKPSNVTIDPHCADLGAQLFDHETVDKEGFDVGVPFGTKLYADFSYYPYSREKHQKSSQKKDIFAFGIWLMLAYVDAIGANPKCKENIVEKFYPILAKNIKQEGKKFAEIPMSERPGKIGIDTLAKIVGRSINQVHKGSGTSVPVELKQLIAEMIQGDREKRPTIDEVITRLRSLKEGILAEHTPPTFAKKANKDSPST